MSWTQGLNPEQAKAVQHNYGPLLILAGAGSGKTTVLVARTGRLIAEGIAAPESIVVLTFTNKAARELKHRVAARLGEGPAKKVWAGTFHSFGLQILRQYHQEAGLPKHFGVIDQSDCISLLREFLRDIRVVGKDKYDLDLVLELINELRVHGKITKVVQNEYKEMAEMLRPKFEAKLELMAVLDFEGLLLKPLELFKKNPDVAQKVRNKYQQIMVDEFQDTNALQMRLINQLIGKERNIAVVGDDDQSIYGWRGAEVKNILNFPKNYAPCEVIRLERNYRSSPLILEVANEVIAKNKNRHGKVLRPEGSHHASTKPEAFLLETENEEAEFVLREIQGFLRDGMRPEDIAVLYRSNSQGGMIESVLRQAQIPYQVSGGTAFFDRKEIKDVLAYLRCSLNPNDVSLRRIINTPSRGIGETTLEKLSAVVVEKRIQFVKVAREWRSYGIQEKTGESIDQLLAWLSALPAKIMDPQSTKSPGTLMLSEFHQLGYKDYLASISPDPQSAEKKWLGVDILGRILDGFVKKGGTSEKTLREFIDAMELRDDGSDDEKKSEVSLMTLHAAKGLEFPVVFLIGVEEDLLPHKNLGSDVDEERRLFYVGLTRAKQKLILSRCKTRKRNGVTKPVSPSRFLLEISGQKLADYKSEFRPVSSEQRQDLLAGFLSNLDAKIGSKQKQKR